MEAMQAMETGNGGSRGARDDTSNGEALKQRSRRHGGAAAEQRQKGAMTAGSRRLRQEKKARAGELAGGRKEERDRAWGGGGLGWSRGFPWRRDREEDEGDRERCGERVGIRNGVAALEEGSRERSGIGLGQGLGLRMVGSGRPAQLEIVELISTVQKRKKIERKRK